MNAASRLSNSGRNCMYRMVITIGGNLGGDRGIVPPQQLGGGDYPPNI